MSKFVDANKNIEKAVVSGYKAIENSVVGSYKKIENRFVDAFLTPEDGTQQAENCASMNSRCASEVGVNGMLNGFKSIENGMVSGYKAIEQGVVTGYKAIESTFIRSFLGADTQTAAENLNTGSTIKERQKEQS
jgi:hypothetical protein